MNLFPFIPGYTHAIYHTGRQVAFVILVSFLITFILTRGYTRIARVRGWGSASVGGVHMHHIVVGVVLALGAATIEFAFLPHNQRIILLLAVFFGVGASLILDEFALVFHLKDVYWENEGRKSIDAVVIAVALGAVFLLRTTPLGVTTDDSRWFLSSGVILNLLFVLLAAYKGKFFMAVFGVFFPILALIGAIRLAEPNSPWANKYYKKDGKKYRKSINRYKAYEKRWGPRKAKLWDIIGGKPGRFLDVG